MLRIALAGFHLLALGLGLGAVMQRGSALREPDASGLARALRADTLWGIAAGLWIGTGVWRLLAGVEKPTAYYFANSLFMMKMTLLVLILALEVWPMVTLIRYRVRLGRGEPPLAVLDANAARRMAVISHVQAALVVLMVFAAVAMARGFGVRALPT